MSRLGDIENALVSRLAAATSGGSPVFVAVQGLSGGHRRAIQQLLRRRRTPAAFVAFTDEPTAPETPVGRKGAQFAVLVAARALRAGSDPRHGDADATGAFDLLDVVRTQLDDYVPVAGLRAVNLRERFVEADERCAVYESLYRIEPVATQEQGPPAPETLLAFDGESPGEVDLSWTAGKLVDGTDEPVLYNIYRKRSGESVFTLQDAVPAETLSVTLPSQPAEETLQYHVTGENTGSEGPASNVVVIMV